MLLSQRGHLYASSKATLSFPLISGVACLASSASCNLTKECFKAEKSLGRSQIDVSQEKAVVYSIAGRLHVCSSRINHSSITRYSSQLSTLFLQLSKNLVRLFLLQRLDEYSTRFSVVTQSMQFEDLVSRVWTHAEKGVRCRV